jgi:hypothetical protein
VTVSLGEAVDFVLNLDTREQASGPKEIRDPNVFDVFYGTLEGERRLATRHGFVGELNGPSTEWIKDCAFPMDGFYQGPERHDCKRSGLLE